MERLTFEGDFCNISQCAEPRGGRFCESGACSQRKVWERLKTYEDTGLTPEEVLSMKMDMAIICAMFQNMKVERMRELAKADKDGRLVVLLCKVGDTVYLIPEKARHIKECVVSCICLGSGSHIVAFDVTTHWDYGAALDAFGRSVFLTREEAEKALKEVDHGSAD